MTCFQWCLFWIGYTILGMILMRIFHFLLKKLFKE